MKREQDRLEKMLRKLPRHKLNENEREEIHDTLMHSRMNRAQLKKKNRRSHKVIIGLASMAALVLFAVLGLSFFQDTFTNTAGDGKQSSEESGHLDSHQSPDKQTPDMSSPDSDHNDELNNNAEESEESASQDNQATDDTNDQSDTVANQQDIQALSDQVIDALDNRNMEAVAHYVHPEKGLLFSPYIYVTEDAVVFSKNEVDTMLDQSEVFDWGRYDGKGTPIDLTPAEFFDEFLDMTPYQNSDEILVNDMQDRGNTVNNIKDVFPDAQVIEYYDEGSEKYAGIDWSSVLLVYEKDEAEALQLVAIIRDMWTI